MSPETLIRVIVWMQAKGSSLLLNWAEDDGLWECSWITSGNRHVGHSTGLDGAIRLSLESAGAYDDAIRDCGPGA